MKKILEQLVPRTVKFDKGAEKTSQQADWQRCGHIYYLLNTLKLSYESHCGRVTYEKLNFASLHELCAELQKGQYIAPKETAHLPELFSLSVCGVCWEEFGAQVRTKAIPEAACIRFENIEYSASEAKFQMAYRMTDDGVTPLCNQAGFDKAVRRINNISVAEFIRFLEACNTRIPRNLVNKLGIRSENFDSVFTLTESHLLEKLLEKEALMNAK
ncbi:hypothetical protein MHO82_06020 [Vibrio sp. Of7-15]|uniref:hypothetical protein n=1 Tax=Vibrio sp. Of7-15 TaxID=2724879 RepID=UPI001EF3C8AC|nr:hypothetical protein [Vibrio sp. Of7-15]MCG7496411.1 hypothetical protein [Vibrio sp. Of7-15]